MDSETLFSLALLLIYFVFQAFSGKKKQKNRQPRPIPTSETERSDLPDAREANAPPQSLEDALREIREALGGPASAPEPARPKPEAAQPRPEVERPHPLVASPRPAPTLPPKLPETRDLPQPREFPKQREMLPRREFQPVATDHREAHFLKDIPPTPPYRPLSSSAAVRMRDQTEEGRQRHLGLRERLKDPRASRDAILLAEILGPPRARRRRR